MHEWQKTLEWISQTSSSRTVREYIVSKKRYGSRDDAEKEYSRLREMDILHETETYAPSFDLDPLFDVLEKIDAGEGVEPREMRSIGDFLTKFRKSRELLVMDQGSSVLEELVSSEAPDIGLEMRIRQTINDRGKINSEASEELGKIRYRLRRTHENIDAKIRDMLKNPTVAGMLQEDYFTIRDDRYVLPFKSSFKRTIKGVIHHYSRTGQTAFLEPLPLLELNNSLSLQKSKEDEEIQKILKHLLAVIKSKRGFIKNCAEIAVHLMCLDIICRWRKKHKCSVPEFVDYTIDVEKAWYPLVYLSEREKLVKNDFIFRAGEKVMVISGPNAGGKTVALKTLRTVVELSVRGIPVTADKAVIPFFRDVFIILGDRQDTERGESSFSAHLRDMSEVLNAAEKETLILVDEIGTGTDPLQGGAIARAFLEYVKDRSIFTLVTSHLAEVKSIALEDSSFVPVAMGFDEKTDEPTYNFIYNLVGGSNALSLVGKIDFPNSFVRRLEELLLTSEHAAEPLINRLRRKEQEINELRKKAGKLQEEAEREKNHLKKLRISLEKKEKVFDEKRLKSLDKLLFAEEKELKKRIKEMTIKKGKERLDKIRDKKTDIKRKLEKIEMEKDTTEGIPLELVKEEVIPGETVVYDKLMKMKGVLSSLEKDRAVVNISGKKITVPFERILTVKQSGKKGEKVPHRSKERTDFRETLDIRGKKPEEARLLIEKKLDECFIGGTYTLVIIHGHGTGVLKKYVRELLTDMKKQYRILFFPAPPDKGGDGATMVDFDRK